MLLHIVCGSKTTNLLFKCVCAFPSFCGPQERLLLYLDNVTDCNDSAAPQQQQQQPASDTEKEEEDITPNVLNFAYSGVLCDEEVVGRDGNKNSRTPESNNGSSNNNNNNNSHLVCASSNRIRNERDEVARCADMSECIVTGGGVAADIESGREGLLVAVLDR